MSDSLFARAEHCLLEREPATKVALTNALQEDWQAGLLTTAGCGADEREFSDHGQSGPIGGLQGQAVNRIPAGIDADGHRRR